MVYFSIQQLQDPCFLAITVEQQYVIVELFICTAYYSVSYYMSSD
jgi:hypothetical protein